MRGVFAGIVDGAVRFFYDYDHELENEPFVNLVRAGADFIIGLYYGFPICCNIAYCRDTANDRSPGIRRDYEIREAGRKPNHELGYVPCLPCALTTDAQPDQVTQKGEGMMDESKPVIFLDIDGVLVTRESLVSGGGSCMDRGCVALLNKFVEDTDAEIVISSSWRILRSLDFIRGALACAGLRDFRRVIDATDKMVRDTRSEGGLYISSSDKRANEIKAWLRQNPRERFVIFDDDLDAEIPGHYVRTDMDRGLTYAHLNAALEILHPEIITTDAQADQSTQPVTGGRAVDEPKKTSDTQETK